MGRASLVVKKNELQECVNSLEKEKDYTSVGDLCTAVSESEWGKAVRSCKHIIKGISPQMVYVKLRELDIVCKTKPGKRGRQSGDVPKVCRSEKLSTNKRMSGWTKRLLAEIKDVPEKYKSVAEKAANGNIKACVVLKCSQCLGYEGQYKACQGFGPSGACGIYPLNLLYFPNRNVMVEDKNSGLFTCVREGSKLGELGFEQEF